MAEEWTVVFQEVVDGRPIAIFSYAEDGSFRIDTTQADDDPAAAAGSESNIKIVSPTAGGRVIEEFAADSGELAEKLFQLGVSEKRVTEIVRKL